MDSADSLAIKLSVQRGEPAGAAEHGVAVSAWRRVAQISHRGAPHLRGSETTERRLAEYGNDASPPPTGLPGRSGSLAAITKATPNLLAPVPACLAGAKVWKLRSEEPT